MPFPGCLGASACLHFVTKIKHGPPPPTQMSTHLCAHPPVFPPRALELSPQPTPYGVRRASCFTATVFLKTSQ